jgi:hypothetical protein
MSELMIRDVSAAYGQKTESRFPTKGTCLAIYSRCVNAETPIEQVLGASFPWCSGKDVAAHGSMPHLGVNAAYKAARVLTALATFRSTWHRIPIWDLRPSTWALFTPALM